jgi:hypothetical protein
MHIGVRDSYYYLHTGCLIKKRLESSALGYAICVTYMEFQIKALNPSKPKLVKIIFKTSVRVSNKTLHHYKNQTVFCCLKK